MSKYEVLKQELETAIARLGRDSEHHKRLHRNFRYAAFALTALSTTLAGAAAVWTGGREYLTFGILVTSAVAGAATAIEGIRKPGELWVHERAIYYQLIDLQRELKFLGSAADEAEVNRLFSALQNILSAAATNWIKMSPGQNRATQATENQTVS